MNILFAGVECYPFIKNGGLGDVLSSLPKELNSLGANARVILPKYSSINEDYLNDIEFVNSFYVFLGTKVNKVSLYKKEYQGTVYYFIESDKYFSVDKISGIPEDYERLALYQIGVIESMKYMSDFKVDILNCHDWQTGLIPQLIKTKYYKELGYVKTVFTIHNVLYQGEFDRQTIKIYNIPFDNIMNKNGKIDFMKSAILCADYVNTVSETYGRELLASEYTAMGLSEPINQKRKKGAFFGILNGIDYECYNPMTDKYLPLNYDRTDFEKGKIESKKKLYSELGVDFFTSVPLIGIIGKLSKQKGIDLVMNSIDELLLLDKFKLVVVGEGEKIYEDFFKDLEKRHPFKVKCYIGYSDELAHLLYSASDMYLMPSAFEPCGLGQMIALRYGTIPIVRETGGLKDSIEPFNVETETGNGFRFTSFNQQDMKKSILEAFEVYEMKDKWNKLVYNALSSNYSFRVSAIKYYKMYRRLLTNK